MAGSDSPMGRSQGQRGSMAGIARPSTASPGGRVQAFGSPSSSPFAALGGSFKGNSLQSMPGPERESIRPATAAASRQRRSSVDISRQLFAQSCSVCKRKYPDECLCVAEVVSHTPPRYLLPTPISPIPASFPPCPSRASVLNVCAIHLQEKRKKAEEVAEWKRKRLAAGLSTQTDEEMQERIQVKLCVSPLSSLSFSASPAPLSHFLPQRLFTLCSALDATLASPNLQLSALYSTSPSMKACRCTGTATKTLPTTKTSNRQAQAQGLKHSKLAGLPAFKQKSSRGRSWV